MTTSPRKVAIVGGNRIPFARSNGTYADASNQDMLTAAIDGLASRYHLQGAKLGMVAAGAVLKHSRDFNLVRECVLGSALDPATPAYDIQQACATGMEALSSISNKIKLGQIEAGIAGGDGAEALAGQAVAGDEAVDGGGEHVLVRRVAVFLVGARERDAVAADDDGAARSVLSGLRRHVTGAFLDPYV